MKTGYALSALLVLFIACFIAVFLIITPPKSQTLPLLKSIESPAQSRKISGSSENQVTLKNYFHVVCVGTSTADCAIATPAGNTLKDWLSLIFSLLALITSLTSLFFTWKKNKADVSRSVNDQYWIRQIISPFAIQPLLETLGDLAHSIPKDCNQSTDENYQSYVEVFQPQLQKLGIKIQSLKIVEDELFRSIAADLDQIEELLLNYCGNNGKKLKDASGDCVSPQTTTIIQLHEMALKILTTIKKFQMSKV